MTVGVLEACGGGLVHHRKDIPAGSAEGLKGEEALRRPRVRRDAHESLERLRCGEGGDGGIGAQLVLNVAEEASQCVEN